MKPYPKVPQSNTDLAILLQNRGLVANSTKLLRILETVGYYRFTGLQRFLWKRAVHGDRVMRYNVPHEKEDQRWT